MTVPLRICLFSPYIPDHFGGGERYLFSVAEFLSRHHQVFVALPRASVTKAEAEVIRKKYEQFFSLDLERVEFIGSPLRSKSFFIQKLLWTKQFDVVYYLTDGSLFFSLAKRNILHIQFPFTHSMKGIFNTLKLNNWQVKNTNSHFTKDVIERTWKTKVDLVHTPYVDTHQFKPATKKSKIILHVGRFFSHLHTKRQDMLVRSFKHLVDQHPQAMKGWKFVMIGGVEDQLYADKIAKQSEGYPIKIIHNASIDTLRSYYAISKIYWHATGYGADEYLSPLSVEHFGISTLEAMASGAVPIVINKGGQKELVEHGVNGFLWNELDALEERTLATVTGEFDVETMSERARETAMKFSPKNFFTQINEMIELEEPIPHHLSTNVSIVIPTYNGKHLLEKNLESVIHSMKSQDELLIVDDASNDDTVQWLIETYNLKKDEDRAQFSDYVYKGEKHLKSKQFFVTLVQNKQNERFGASCNKGVSLSKYDLVFVLNNDVRPEKHTLSHLVTNFLHPLSHENILFGVGCLEIEKKDGRISNHAGKNKLWFERGLFLHSKADEFSSGDTAWVSGGSGLFHKQKWLELGGFHPQYYPAYWEDIDLSFRARKHHWKVLFDEEAVVEHRHESTNQTAFGKKEIEIMSFRNAILFTWTHANIWQKFQFIAWLPYHLTITNKRTNGTFFRGFFRSFKSSVPRH